MKPLRSVPWRTSALLAVGVTILTLLGISAPGSAAPGNGGTASTAKVQTVKADLNKAERQLMQSQIDAYLAKTVGGKQISINQIAFDGGKTILTLPLPGQSKAQAIGETVSPMGTADCLHLWSCLYADTNFNGLRLARTVCGTVNLVSAGFGYTAASIHNNQTNGTQTVVKNSSGQILNANAAPSRVNDMGVGGVNLATSWVVC